MKQDQMKILVQRADRLGDMVFTLPVFEHLKVRYPHAKVHVLTSAIGKKLLDEHPKVDKIITCEFDKKGHVKKFFELKKKIKKEKYTVYISLFNHPAMAYLGWSADIPIRIGDASNCLLQLFYNKKIEMDWNDLTTHQIEYNLKHLHPLFINPKTPLLNMYIDSDIHQEVKGLLKKFLPPKKQNILIMVSTGGSNFPLPEESILGFVKKVEATGKFNIILAGQLDKKAALVKVRGDSLLNLVNKTSLKELMAVIQESDFVVGGDTGPIHIASFLNKPIVFYSPKASQFPSSWGPRSPYFRIIRKEYAYNPQLNIADSQHLYEAFCDLCHDVSLNLAMTTVQKGRRLLLHSLRILYLVEDKTELMQAMPAIRKIREAGLAIIICPIPRGFLASFFRVFRMVRRHNTMVIQGRQVSKLGMGLLRLSMGVFCGTRKPISLTQSFHEYIEPQEYLDLYYKVFRKI